MYLPFWGLLENSHAELLQAVLSEEDILQNDSTDSMTTARSKQCELRLACIR